jgi:membrane protein
LIVISILGSATVDEADRQAVLGFAFRYFPRQFDFLTTQLDAFRNTRLQVGLGGSLALVWASLGVFGAVSSAVNHAWGVEKHRSFLGHRVFSFLMLATAGVLLFVALLLTSAVQITEASWFAGIYSRYPTLKVLRGLTVRYATLLLPSLVFGLIYYFVPNVKVIVKDVWLGALFTGLLWNASLAGFSWFVRDLSQFSAIHGSIAAVVVFLLWVYLSAVILLYGVEFTATYGKMRRDLRAAAADRA